MAFDQHVQKPYKFIGLWNMMIEILLNPYAFLLAKQIPSAFNTKDGFGIKALINSGFEVAVITGRHSQIVQQRMTSLTVQHIYQGQEDKLIAYQELKDKLGLTDEQIAYIGDDGPDLPVMEKVGFAVAVNDAHPLIKKLAHYTTLLPGGFGAVRELTDLLMLENGKPLTSDGTSA